MNDLKGIIEDCNKSDLVSDKVIKKVIEIIGQEEWHILNDENNDVCTTMGELIITLKGIAELEKENAELKDALKGKRCNCMTYFNFKDLEKHLTKAKELLKWFVWYFREGSPNLVPYKHKVAEAEQFLNEVEK